MGGQHCATATFGRPRLFQPYGLQSLNGWQEVADCNRYFCCPVQNWKKKSTKRPHVACPVTVYERTCTSNAAFYHIDEMANHMFPALGFLNHRSNFILHMLCTVANYIIAVTTMLVSAFHRKIHLTTSALIPFRRLFLHIHSHKKKINRCENRAPMVLY